MARVANQIRTVLDKPVQIGHEVCQVLRLIFADKFHAQHGNQPYQRTHAKFMKLAARKAENVVEEPFFFIPQLVIAPAHLFHGCADADEMLEELGSQAFVHRAILGKLESDAHHVQAEKSHPSGGVRLLENGAGGKFFAAVNNGDVVESEKAAFENIQSLAIDLVHPPGEIDQQLMKTLFQEFLIRNAGTFFFHLVNAPAGPSLHRRV